MESISLFFSLIQIVLIYVTMMKYDLILMMLYKKESVLLMMLSTNYQHNKKFLNSSKLVYIKAETSCGSVWDPAMWSSIWVLCSIYVQNLIPFSKKQFTYFSFNRDLMRECMRSCYVSLYMSSLQHLCSKLNSFQQKTVHLFLSLNSSTSFSLLTIQFF